MAYAEDLAALARYRKLRLAACIAAVASAIADLVVDVHWVVWLEPAAWGFAGIFALLEGRAEKRLGRDGDASTMYAVLLFVLAAFFVVRALKS